MVLIKMWVLLVASVDEAMVVYIHPHRNILGFHTGIGPELLIRPFGIPSS